MTCEKCPEGQPLTLPKQGNCACYNYVFYSSGLFAEIYPLVAQAIPEGADLKHGRPTVHADGALEYPPGADEVEDIPGYQRDDANRRLFRPVWPDCPFRMIRVGIQDRLLEIRGVCLHAGTGHPGLTTSLDQCQKCAVRPHYA